MGRAQSMSLVWVVASIGCTFVGAEVPVGPDSAPDAQRLSCGPRYSQSFGTSLYRFESAALDWWSAERDCESDGGHLATVESLAESEFLRGLQKQPADLSLGLSDHASEGQFRFVTGAVLTESPYQSWLTGQPNDLDGAEDCVILRLDGLWRDDRCDRASAYVCECDLVPIPDPAPWCETGTNANCSVCGDECPSATTCGPNQRCA